MTPRQVPVRRLLGGLAAVFFVVAATLAPAAAHATTSTTLGAEAITSYSVDLAVAADAVLHVREQIAYDFGATPHHGIERQLFIRTPYGHDTSHDRVYRITNIQVSASPGTPAQLSVHDQGDTKTLRIGDPNQLITGLHTYAIRYDVTGAMQSFSDHDELYWNVIGGWPVPITNAVVRVPGPAAVTRVACFEGPTSSTLPCTGARIVGGVAVFRQPNIAPDDILTIVAAFPPGTVAKSAPILQERRTIKSAFAISALSLALTTAVLVALLAWLAWVYWIWGRDRRYIGQIPGLAPAAGQRVADEPVPLTGAPPIAVEFAPPDHVLPGEVGTLLDEQANTLDVTATIVDLACRGYLRIEQTEPAHRFHSADWKLSKTDKAPDDLVDYEQRLFGAIFESGSTVSLSDLKGHFAGDLSTVQNKMYDDVVAKGWFARRPDQVRAQWLGVGLAIAFAGVIATFFLARHTHLALVGIAVIVAGSATRSCASSRRCARTWSLPTWLRSERSAWP